MIAAGLSSVLDDLPNDICTIALLTACDSEQAGAVALGFTKLSWNDGDEQQPLSAFKSWEQLTANEKAGAALLGYTQVSWDNVSPENQPASAFKSWDELLVCEEGEYFCPTPSTHVFQLLFLPAM